MKAVVMAGGEGTRLRPLTSNQPKPMVPVAGKPCMEHIIELVHRHGMREVVATLAFLPQVIRGYFGSGSQLGVEIDYSVEEVPAGTAGSVKQAQHSLTETFMVISGDALTDFDLTELVAAHRRSGALATLALKRVPDPAEFGVVLCGPDGRIERFVEKPSPAELFSDTINTGIYVLEPEVLDHVPDGVPYDFSRELYPRLLAEEAPLYGVELEGYWQDIGTVDQYQEATRAALDGEVELDIPGTRLRGNVHVGEGAIVGDIDNIQGPAVIGNYCNVDPHAIVGRYTVLGNNVVMKEYAETQNCVVDANSYLGPRSQVRGAVIGKRCDVRAHAIVSEGVVIGDEVSIGAQAVIAPNVRVYPTKRIETGAQVETSLIYESRGMERLFGEEGVSGLVNLDITPESATRLAMAYGTALAQTERVVVSRDAHPAARMIKRAMTSGLMSTGVSLEDLRVASSAQNRFEVKNTAAAGGIHMRISDSDPECAELLFFDGQGVAAGDELRKQVERFYYRHEYRHAPLGRLGEIAFPPRVTETYVGGLLAALDTGRIRSRRFRIVVDYAFSSAAMVMPAVLRGLGVEHVSAHAFLDPDEATIATADHAGFTDQTKKLVSAIGADVGVVLDRSAERVTLVDELGEEIPSDVALFLVLSVVAKHARAGSLVVIPANVSRVAEAIVEPSGVEVVRSRISPVSLARAAVAEGVVFAGSPTGGFVFPEFLPGYDAIMSLAKVLELLALEQRPLSALCAQLPRATLIHKRTPVPWSLKGLAMREVAEALRGEQVDLLEGVRVQHDSGWAQVVPDTDEPIFHIYAEGETSTESARLAERYRRLVEQVLADAEHERV